MENFELAKKAADGVNKRWGDGSMQKLGDMPIQDIDVISTGSVGLDVALGVGGIPRGRVAEIYGEESTGKTTICQHIVAEAQALGLQVAYIDMEHALDPAYAVKCGVDVKNLYISQPDTGEEALEIAEAAIRSGGFGCVVVDSVAALVPKAEIEGDMGDSHMGMQARLMSQALRKINNALSESKTSLIFTNQQRNRFVKFGNPKTTAGGVALKYYASVRIELRFAGVHKKGEEQIGTRIKAIVVKNKVAPPFKNAELSIMYDEGISKASDLLDSCVKHGLIELSSNNVWYTINEETYQGRDAARQFLRANPDTYNDLREKLFAKMKEDAKIEELSPERE